LANQLDWYINCHEAEFYKAFLIKQMVFIDRELAANVEGLMSENKEHS